MTKRKPLTEFLGAALGRSRQKDLAASLGISPSTVSLWVRGKREVPERYRTALRNAARGFRITAPPRPTTKAGTVRRTRGSVIRKPLSGGRTHIKARALSTFTSELGRLAAAGQTPSGLTITVHDFRGANSAPGTGRPRRISVGNLSSSEMSALSSGSRAALEDLLTRTIQATNYNGAFTYGHATDFDFQV